MLASALHLFDGPREVAADEKTMFEIYRESDYNRAFRYIFYTDLEEHGRDSEVSKAASGETAFSGFLADDLKEQARAKVEETIDELNDMDDDDGSPGLPQSEIEKRLAAFLVAGPTQATH